ncbi:MAG: GNAT family N-acetyltransferase [Propionibacteriaceae bacterium]|jgi:ribosomal-protein-serine acetyltransferase|nr:GNAT family N-acetyltransferase [Propionibacteriaceae bacterium]
MFYRHIDDHLCLKLVSPFDAEAFFAIIDAERDRLGRWLPWVWAMNSVEEERKSLADLTGWPPPKQICTALVLDGQVIGSVGLPTIDLDAKWAEIGYWIGSAHEGKGYVTSGVRELEKLVFLDLGLAKTQISVDVDNVRSRSIPERLGYSLDGTLRRSLISDNSGRVADRCVYSLLREEWDARESANP